jgi:sugar lactone lactonase YvrE
LRCVDGRLDRAIELPVSKPSMCAFGGSQLDTLSVASIQPAGAVGEHDGCVLMLNPGVTKLLEPAFAGTF